MAQLYLNDNGDIMITNGNLQDIINQYSVSGTGDISDLNLPITGDWSSSNYGEGSDWFISTQEEQMIVQEIFTLEQLKADGLGVIDLKDNYTILELLLVGFTLLELYQGEIAPNLLVQYGFSFKQLIDAGVNDILFTLNTSAQQTTLVQNIVDDVNSEFYFDIDEQDIYITHENDNKIIKVTESSSVYTSSDLITSGLNKPSGIIKRNNELFISNAGDHTIIISDLNGNINDGVYAGNNLGLSGDNDNTNTLRFENNNYNIKISEFNSLINNPGEMFLDNTDILFLDKGNKSVKTINYTQLGNTFNQNDIIYISNSDSHTISRYFDNALSEWIGKDGVSGDVDGNSETTRLNKPGDLLIEQVNNIDHLYFLDKGNNALKTINTSYPISCTKIIDGFNNPEGFMKDNDDFYVADTGNNKIVKITPGAGGYSSSDFATGIPSPKDIIKHNDLLFVSCGDHSIKRISSDGTFTTVSGLENNSGLINGLDAILEFDDFKQKDRPSRYNNPNQMQLDNLNNLLIVDTDNNVIRNLEIKPIVNTTYTGIHYIAEEGGTIKKYIPTAYPPLIDFVESLNNPVKLALKGDDIFVCNIDDNELAKINPTTGTKTTISNTLNNPNSILIEGDDLYVADTGNNKIVKITPEAGGYSSSDFATGITSPKDIVKNSDGNFFISTGENTIIRINSTNVKETISGVKNQTNNINGTDMIEYIEISFEASVVDDDNLMKVDTLFQSRYNSPEYMLLLDVNNILLVDKGNNEIKNLNITYSSYTNTGALFVTENNFHTVKKINLEGKIAAFAGIEDDKGTTNGALGVNKFDSPKGLTQDANRNLLIVDSGNNQIRKIDKTTGITTVFASGFNNPTDIVKVADTSILTVNYETFLVSDTDSHKIKKIIAKNPVEVSDYIGSGVAGHFDGVGVLAELNKPEGLYVDSSGNVFIADSGTHSIRKIESDGKVITESGLPNVSGQNNGQGNNATFNNPNSLTMINNKLYISDSSNHAIREGIITYDAGGIFDEIPIQTIKASDEIENNYFGQVVSCDDNYLLISSKHTDNKGKVYVYKISGDQWIEIATIQPNDLVTNDEFGKSLVIYNNTAFIGCENKNDKKGMVYIYQKQLLDDSTWNLIQVLEGSDTDKDYLFGKTISVYNEELFIGAPKVENSDLVGQVYRFKYNDIAGLTGYWGVYQNNKWKESEIITPDDSEINDQFGCSIQLSNTFAIIGAKYKNLNDQSGKTGTVYTYVKKSPNIWLQLNTDPLTIEVTTGDEYGITVGLSKTAGQDYTNQQTIIIAAWKKDNPENSGRVYLYNLSSIPSGPVIYTLAFDSRTKEWKSEYLSDLVPALPNDGGMGESLIYDGNNWNTSSNGWIIKNINQPINIIEKNLATTGSWSSDIINL